MNWFMNLDKLPAGTHQYTAYLANRREDGTFEPGDEVDFQGSDQLTGFAAQTAASDAAKAEGYEFLAQEGTAVVVGVVDQSDNEVVYDARAEYGLLGD